MNDKGMKSPRSYEPRLDGAQRRRIRVNACQIKPRTPEDEAAIATVIAAAYDKTMAAQIEAIQERHRLDAETFANGSPDTRLRERMIHADRGALLAILAEFGVNDGR